MLAVESLLFIAELIGTIAFAISGAVVAVERGLDLFGVLFLGVMTAMGGGVFRDILLGQTPPRAFLDHTYFLVAAGTALAVFLWKANVKHFFACIRWVSPNVLNFCDAVGLGIFSIVGVQSAISAGFSDIPTFCVFLGMITGIGGGMLRDVMSGGTPIVLRGKIYATASIAGSICYYCIWSIHRLVAIVCTIGLVVFIRVLASHYCWELPKVQKTVREGKNVSARHGNKETEGKQV